MLGPRLLVLATGLIAMTTMASWAQHHKAGPGAVAGPFDLTIHGAFQRMMHTQDFTAKVQLKSVIDGGATEAVGAVADLRGEITAIDGKILVSYGKPCPACAAPGEERATLLVTARVTGWQEPIALPADLAGTALDDFIVARIKERGLDATKPLPIRMKGTLTGVKMHVLRAANPAFKGHGSGHSMADQEEIVADRIEGEVVGFYAPAAVQGIITHPGEPFHYHWVDLAHTRTTHLDVFGMAKGAQLLLPKQ